jgi:hypothetical protein
MARSIFAEEKKRGRGRPRTGEQPALSARVPTTVLVRVDQWAAVNNCTRSEAVAALLGRGLEADAKPRQPAKRGESE